MLNLFRARPRPDHRSGRPLAGGPRRLPGRGHRRGHRRHRRRGGGVHRTRPAVPRCAAGHRLRPVRHDRRRDGAGPWVQHAVRGGARLGLRPHRGRRPVRRDRLVVPGQRAGGARRRGTGLPGRGAGDLVREGARRGRGAHRGRRSRRAPRAPDRVAGRHRLRGARHPVLPGRGAVAARGRLGVDGRAADRRRPPVGPRAWTRGGRPRDRPGPGCRGRRAAAGPSRTPTPVEAPGGSARLAGRGPARPRIRRPARAAFRGAGPVDRRARRPGRCSRAGPRSRRGAHRRRVRGRLARRPRPARTRRRRGVPARRATSPSAATVPGCGGCGRTCAGSSPPPPRTSWTPW